MIFRLALRNFLRWLFWLLDRPNLVEVVAAALIVFVLFGGK